MDPIKPSNLTAQIAHRARGNPPSTLPETAISNCFPGLEVDFRNVWRRLFKHLELHESTNLVTRVDPDAPAQFQELFGHRLVRIGDLEVTEGFRALEWSNLLAELLASDTTEVECLFTPLLPDWMTARASSSLTEVDRSGFLADQDPETPWISEIGTASEPQSLEFDLILPREISAVRLMPARTAGQDFFFLFPRNFEIRVGENEVAEQTIASESDFTPQPGQWNVFSFDSRPVRYIRIEIHQLIEFAPGQFATALGEVGVELTAAAPAAEKRATLELRPTFEHSDGQLVPVIREEMALPGELSQSLCSPWQNDYRECACFYWAASRPDFVNVEDGTKNGHNWLDRTRSMREDPETGREVPFYEPEVVLDPEGNRIVNPRLHDYDELFVDWERLRFQREGKDRGS